jgi:hypothetical protein
MAGKGDFNPGSGSGNPGGKEDRREEVPTRIDVNMVLTITAKFHAPMEDVTELVSSAERAMFEKLGNPGAHMNPLFIWDI